MVIYARKMAVLAKEGLVPRDVGSRRICIMGLKIASWVVWYRSILTETSRAGV